MKKLNLRTPKPYDFSSEKELIEVRKKYYCISEGPTEESYFRGVRNNKSELRIKNDVYLEVIEKQVGQEAYSHPMQLVNACLVYMGHLDDSGNEIPKEKWKEHCKWKDYDPEIDYVCVIFDRDYRHLEKWIDEILAKCEQHGIRIILSNPNFELWLLMHFPDIEQYPEKMLLENKKNLKHQLFEDSSEQKTFLEILLSKKAEGYKKGKSIIFEKYLPYIDQAVRQAKSYCEELPELFYRLGTSVGRLIEDMRK